MKTTLKRILIAGAVSAALGLAGTQTAQAGSIYLTGHDVDLHGNQNGYSSVILNYLRGAGTGGEIAAASYKIGVLRSNDVSGTFFNPTGFGTISTMDPSADFANAAAFSAWLSTIDVLEIASYRNCGGCDLSLVDSGVINGYAPQIAAFFNAGGDIWGNSGDGLPTYYNFLPPSAAASGTSIGGSSGFTATAAGLGIGIATNMINGFPTHNRFTSFDPDFTVFEVRGTEVISIGIRDATITGGEVKVPEPASLALLGLGMFGLVWSRRKKA